MVQNNKMIIKGFQHSLNEARQALAENWRFDLLTCRTGIATWDWAALTLKIGTPVFKSHVSQGTQTFKPLTLVCVIEGTAIGFCCMSFWSFRGGSPVGFGVTFRWGETGTARFKEVLGIFGDAWETRCNTGGVGIGSCTWILSDAGGGRSCWCEKIHWGRVHVPRSGQAIVWKRLKDENIACSSCQRCQLRHQCWLNVERWTTKGTNRATRWMGLAKWQRRSNNDRTTWSFQFLFKLNRTEPARALGFHSTFDLLNASHPLVAKISRKCRLRLQKQNLARWKM